MVPAAFVPLELEVAQFMAQVLGLNAISDPHQSFFWANCWKCCGQTKHRGDTIGPQQGTEPT